MFTALQLTNWLPAEYIDGPVSLIICLAGEYDDFL